MRAKMWATFALSVLFLPPVLGQNSNATNPMQVRLAYAGSTGMTISWNTYSQLTNPTVKFGLSPSLNLTSPVGVSITYPSSSTYNNHAKITGLRPDTLYYYQPQPTNLTAPFTFRTSRLPGDATTFSVALVVDMGVMGLGGLSTTVGTGAASPLSPTDNNTIQSLRDQPGFDFLWHRMSFLPVLLAHHTYLSMM
jgi:acid phosphatase type 7